MAHKKGFDWVFVALGSLLVVFIVLPLLSVLISTQPAVLGETLGDAEVLRSLALTGGCALAATLIAGVSGVPLAYLLARRKFRGKRLVEALIDLPVIIPHTAAGIALLLVFGSRGWVGAPAQKLGVAFTNQPEGIVAAMLFVSVPYLVNLSREAFALVDRELEQQALVEGASAWGAFWHVTLPIAWRGVVAGALMMWARGISEFGAVVILAYHPRIVPVLVYERFTGFGLEAALPVTVILIVLALLAFSLLRGWLMRGNE
jgi:molybdate/tungstate transport system permease protein